MDSLEQRLEQREQEIRELRAQLAEAQETLRAIREGEVDSLIVSTPEGPRVFTLQGADHTYRTIIEQMQEGAVTLVEDGYINYCNCRFAELVKRPLEQVIGSHVREYVVKSDQDCVNQLIFKGLGGSARGEVTLRAHDGTLVPVGLSLSVLDCDGQSSICAVVSDLTERRRAEAVLASEQFVRRLIDNAPIGVAVVGRDLRYALANPAYEAIADGHVVGRTISEVFPSAVAKIVQPAVQQVLDSGQPMEFRDYEAPVHGQTWWNVSEIPLRDAAGNTEAVLILTHDVTQQTIAEEALRQSEHKHRSLFENSLDAIFLTVPNGTIVAANQAACAMFGMTEEEICRAGREGLIDLDDPRHITAMEERARTGKLKGELTFIRKDGTKFPAEVSSVILDGGSRAFVILRDITERKRTETALRESEERMQMALEVSRSFTFQWETTTDRVLRSDSCGRVLGVSGDALQNDTGQSYFQRVHPEDRDRFLRMLDDLTPSADTYHTEYRVIRGDGTTAVLEESGRGCFDTDGKLRRVVGVTTDITERKRGEEELTAARQAAESANVAKSQFLANMSHELRTPMNAILGMIDVALTKAGDPTVQDCLQTAKGSADLLLTLLDDLLDSAKIESGKLELESAPFSLRRMLEQVTRVLSVRASEKGLCFYCRMPEETPDAVMGDRTRLQQVLLNLAGNAIKFTGHGEVEMSAGGLSQDGVAHLEFAVRDTGIGIPPSRREHIFEPFTQADVSMARRFGGTGLGLSICKRLVELMGGTISVESEVDKGSTFRFTVRLPLASGLPPEFEAPLVVPAAASASLNILLVEDNPANQKLATYILQDRGHTVEIAGDGQEAISLTEQNRYDVILMDVQMPGMNGLEATATIRAREAKGKRVPIIAMTAHAMKGDRERCLAAGMDGYLSKPIHGHEMIALVESLAGKSPGAWEVAATTPVLERTPRETTGAVFNLEEAVRLCFRRKDIFHSMVDMFFKEVDRLFPQMRAALQKGDLAEVGNLGHRLKGTVVYLGARQATDAAGKVEQFAYRPAEPAEVEEAIQALEQQCEILKSAVAAHRTAACAPQQRQNCPARLS